MADARYWLLAGPTPAGPFTVPEVHAELAAGRATWDTPACVVGATVWQPLLRTPGVGPHAGTAPAAQPRAATGSAAPVPSPPPLPTPAQPPPASTTPTQSDRVVGVVVVLVVGVGLLALLGWGAYSLYEAVRPYTPTEVCRKLTEAKTPAEAEKHVTPRMQPVVASLFGDPTPDDPDDTFEFTGEADGPTPGTRRVAYRGSTVIPEAGGRVQLAGHFAVVKADGWKVDDFVITGVDGAALPQPISAVDEHRRERLAAIASPRDPSRPPVPATKPAPRATSNVGKLFEWLKDTVGWGGIIVLAVLAAVVWGVREHMKHKRR
jgi:hypothetical protein